jgi:ABC-type multidrug transport system ATPase subunit
VKKKLEFGQKKFTDFAIEFWVRRSDKIASKTGYHAEGLSPHSLIVRQIDFAIPRGTVTGLLGLNGTGKTTTIRMLIGLLVSTRGRSAVLGIDSQQLSPSDRARIGFAVEGHFLYSWMTVASCERFFS